MADAHYWRAWNEYRQGLIPAARADVDRAKALNRDGVRAERQEWPESLAAFQHAEQCFELSLVARRKALEELSAAESSTETASRQIASHERAIAEAEIRRAEAARSADTIRRHLSSNSR